jgi:SAM-dependent methyltransferase
MTTIKGELQERYAELLNTRKSAPMREASIRRLQRLISPHCPPQRTHALDLGAGQGELVEALQRLGFKTVEGVELSPSQVRQAEAHGCHAVHQGDGSATLAELPDACLDLVCCFDVFEHLPHQLCAEWFGQIRRVLKPGGRLIGHVPNGLSPFAGAIYWGDPTHLWCPVPESIQVFCRSSGLQWVGAYENIGASPGLKGRLRSLAWLGVRSALAIANTIATGCNSFQLPWSNTFVFVIERSRATFGNG